MPSTIRGNETRQPAAAANEMLQMDQHLQLMLLFHSCLYFFRETCFCLFMRSTVRTNATRQPAAADEMKWKAATVVAISSIYLSVPVLFPLNIYFSRAVRCEVMQRGNQQEQLMKCSKWAAAVDDASASILVYSPPVFVLLRKINSLSGKSFFACSIAKLLRILKKLSFPKKILYR
jgi:hypothetical protein